MSDVQKVLEGWPKDRIGVTAYTTIRRYELSRLADWVSDWERKEYLELF